MIYEAIKRWIGTVRYPRDWNYLVFACSRLSEKATLWSNWKRHLAETIKMMK